METAFSHNHHALLRDVLCKCVLTTRYVFAKMFYSLPRDMYFTKMFYSPYQHWYLMRLMVRQSHFQNATDRIVCYLLIDHQYEVTEIQTPLRHLMKWWVTATCEGNFLSICWELLVLQHINFIVTFVCNRQCLLNLWDWLQTLCKLCIYKLFDAVIVNWIVYVYVCWWVLNKLRYYTMQLLEYV